MKQNALSGIKGSNESVKTLYLHRSLSSPTQGNRNILTIGVLCCLTIGLVILHEFSSHASTILGPMLISIVMAIIFFAVDGSPETFGLSSFLGFQALMSESLVSIKPSSVVLIAAICTATHGLYYIGQLSRLAKKHYAPWFYTTILLCPIALFFQNLDLQTASLVCSGLLIIIDVIGLWLCLRVAIAIREAYIPWRLVALCTVAFAFFLNGLSILVDSSQHAILYFDLLLVIGTLLNISPMENRVKALTSANTEVAKSKMSEQQRVNEAIAKTTQMLAHDVRRPFAIVQAYLDSISSAKDLDQVRSLVARIQPEFQKNLNSANSMLKDIMAIGRDAMIVPRPHSIYKLINSALSSVFALTNNPNIRFKYHFRHDGIVLGEEEQLKRVFINILQNAEQAMLGRSETITISTFNDIGSKGERISIEIHNTGSFIPKDLLSQVFDAFFTADKVSGTGLGLAVVKKIVQLHGGDVSVASHKTAGTSFRCLLPAKFYIGDDKILLPRLSKELMLASPTNQNSTEDKFLNVAIIEDDAIFSEVLKSKLHNFNVLIFDTPEQFLEFNRSQGITPKNYLFIITDYYFAGSKVNGGDVARQIKETCATPLVLFSNSILESREQSLFDAKLNKDLTNFDEVLKQLQSFLK
jgi:signal transduction histidine kinase